MFSRRWNLSLIAAGLTLTTVACNNNENLVPASKEAPSKSISYAGQYRVVEIEKINATGNTEIVKLDAAQNGFAENIELTDDAQQNIVIGSGAAAQTFQAVRMDDYLSVRDNGLESYRIFKNEDGSIRISEYVGDLERGVNVYCHLIKPEIAVQGTY